MDHVIGGPSDDEAIEHVDRMNTALMYQRCFHSIILYFVITVFVSWISETVEFATVGNIPHNAGAVLASGHHNRAICNIRNDIEHVNLVKSSIHECFAHDRRG